MKRAIKFSIAVCLFSWAMFAIVRFGFGITNETNKMVFTIFESIYMLFPMLAALVLQAFKMEKFNHTGLVNFKISWTWLVAWLLPLAMVFLCILINGCFPGIKLEYSAEQLISQYKVPEEQQELVRSQLSSMPASLMVISTVVSALLAGATINAVFAFGEEYGWRNYLVNALRGKKFWAAALFIGVVWGIWHFPLILLGHNYPNEPYWGVLLMVVMCVLLGAIELYFVLKTKSMVVAAIIHGTINAISGLVMYFVQGGNDFLNGMPGLAGFITMGIVILCLWIFDHYVSKEDIFAHTLDESLNRTGHGKGE